MSTKKPLDPNQQYPWTYRRAIIIGTLLLCAAGLSYLTLVGRDTRLNETLALGYFALAAAVIGSYVFGAVWHDRGLMAYRGNSGRAEVHGFDEEPDEPAYRHGDTDDVDDRPPRPR